MRIQFDGLFEILNRGFAVFERERAENKSAEIIASAQEFFPRFDAFRRTATEFFLFAV